jgi:hypothetical protein
MVIGPEPAVDVIAAPVDPALPVGTKLAPAPPPTAALVPAPVPATTGIAESRCVGDVLCALLSALHAANSAITHNSNRMDLADIARLLTVWRLMPLVASVILICQ